MRKEKGNNTCKKRYQMVTMISWLTINLKIGKHLQVDNQPEDTKAPKYHEKLFDWWVPVTFSRSFQIILAKELKQN
jgi:hypothetical protein